MEGGKFEGGSSLERFEGGAIVESFEGGAIVESFEGGASSLESFCEGGK